MAERDASHPFFSVIIPLHNKGRYIDATLKSVLAQTYENYEIIVVDDGSTDGGDRLAEGLLPQGSTLVRQQNAGETAARNTGIAHAHGDYYAFLDADDCWKPEHLQTLAHLATEYPEADLLVTAYDVLFTNGRMKPSSAREPGTTGCMPSYWTTLATGYDFVWSSATAVTRRAVDAVGPFLPGVTIGGDLEMWARVARFNKVVAYSTDRTAVYNRLAQGNARTTSRIAHAEPFMRTLYEEGHNPDLDEEERASIERKYCKKMVVYIFTTILSGDRKEARRLISDWDYGNPGWLKAMLTVASYLPKAINSVAYKVRLNVF